MHFWLEKKSMLRGREEENSTSRSRQKEYSQKVFLFHQGQDSIFFANLEVFLFFQWQVLFIYKTPLFAKKKFLFFQ